VVGVLVTSGVIIDIIINDVVVVVAAAFSPGKVARECCVLSFGRFFGVIIICVGVSAILESHY
jgi:hypothetical protein